ncbi:hypothetical protein PCANC_14076 [Puccinia coronata f. sp. avenae]|uniref:DNA helicase Pif1-like 2B domain-containing protein n=1 Tax=Puccinia coronata f. sp. avenae TaxID=200324 RepID=A0A2N5SVT6_9BASI|nr:hypothetical protein PCANC_14076 [Puccinia coronata f. sp. avenae]
MYYPFVLTWPFPKPAARRQSQNNTRLLMHHMFLFILVCYVTSLVFHISSICDISSQYIWSTLSATTTPRCRSVSFCSSAALSSSIRLPSLCPSGAPRPGRGAENEKLPGRAMISESINKPCDDADDALPPEVLSTISLPGFPAPSLTLEEGMHVVCLRNLYPGVTNGTRLMITGIQTHVLKCLVMTVQSMNEQL